MIRRWVVACTALAAAACHKSVPPDAADRAAIAPEIARLLPADTAALGGIDFDRLRALGLDGNLAALALPLTDSLKGAKQLVAAWNGAALVEIARGDFTEAPAGAKLAAPGVAVIGDAPPPGSAAPKELMDRAQPLAARSTLWCLARGSAIPRFPGNAANVTTLLRDADWVSITVRGATNVHLEIAAACANDEIARRIEETARAFFALAAAAEAKKPPMAEMLRAVRIERDGQTARLRLDTTGGGLTAFAQVLR